MRLLTWNIERHAPGTPKADVMLERIAAAAADIVCLTEAHVGSMAELGGHVVADVGASWGGEQVSERKVLLWSRTPWRDATPMPALSALGGAVAATCDTDLGPVRIVGVCTPYPFASPGGALPKPPPWSMHVDFVEGLGAALAEMGTDMPTVVVGDFNQFLPMTAGVWKAHHALKKALKHFSVVTEGDIAPMNEQTLDHVAVTRHLRAGAVRGLPRFDAEERPVSDHVGIVVDLEAGGVQIFD